MPFNMDSSFIKLYFGNDKKGLISYAEFSQFLHVSHLFTYLYNDLPDFQHPAYAQSHTVFALFFIIVLHIHNVIICRID